MRQRKGRLELNRHAAVPRGLVLLVDCMLVVAGYYAAYIIRFGPHLPKGNVESLRTMLPWILLITGTVFGSLGLYGEPPYYNGSHTPTSVLVAVAIGELVTMAGAFWFRSFAFPRTIFGIAFPVHICLITLWRRFVESLDKRCHSLRKVLLVCTDPTRLSTVVLSDIRFAEAQSISTVTPDALLSCSAQPCSPAPDTAILLDVPEHHRPALIKHLVNAGTQVFIMPTPADVLMASAKLGQVNDHPVLGLSGFGLSPGQAFVKRLLDVVVAVAGLVTTGPVIALAAAAVLITSGPPVFYSQQRVGFRGKCFRLWKLRSMVNGAELATGAVLSTDADPRVTPVGRILRSLRIDELPQLVNVLLGNMSIVGPRPERPELVREIERRVPEYRSRLLVKPGLTGFAQVRGKYSTRPEDKILFDLMYIANYSLLLDLMIILQTIAVVLTPEKARGVRHRPATERGRAGRGDTRGGAISG
jgi:exopolysaccharide biosynthesis polyprenyl glycosylphosphotransferase